MSLFIAEITNPMTSRPSAIVRPKSEGRLGVNVPIAVVGGTGGFAVRVAPRSVEGWCSLMWASAARVPDAD